MTSFFSLTRNAQKPVGSKAHKLIGIKIDTNILKIAKYFFSYVESIFD